MQHSLQLMLGFYAKKKISLEKIVEKMCHAPAVAFRVKNRGFIREGYYADLVLVDLKKQTTISKENILYKCGWSPFEGTSFNGAIDSTFVNGNRVYHQGNFDESNLGKRLTFAKR